MMKLLRSPISMIALTLIALLAYAIVAHAATPALPVLFQAHLIAHDVTGRTLTATGKGNNLTFNGNSTTATSVVTLEFTSDQILCSAFGGSP